jgi:hypothetical protein
MEFSVKFMGIVEGYRGCFGCGSVKVRMGFS